VTLLWVLNSIRASVVSGLWWQSGVKSSSVPLAQLASGMSYVIKAAILPLALEVPGSIPGPAHTWCNSTRLASRPGPQDFDEERGYNSCRLDALCTL
jgi:hypothetical protein